jgi:serine/threonine protein kinase
MLDGAGKIRITDFGLTSIAASIKGAEARAGTPAYIAPEQFAGRDVTTKSDIYSLGLISLRNPDWKACLRGLHAPGIDKAARVRDNYQSVDAGPRSRPLARTRDPSLFGK